MMTAIKKAAPAKKPPSQIKQPDHSTRQAAEKLLGAVILQPQLAAQIPLAIHAQLSPYGRFVLKACTEGWGIEGIRHALDDFGLDGAGIVCACLSAVRGDPVNAFWAASRHLCGEVLP